MTANTGSPDMLIKNFHPFFGTEQLPIRPEQG